MFTAKIPGVIHRSIQPHFPPWPPPFATTRGTRTAPLRLPHRQRSPNSTGARRSGIAHRRLHYWQSPLRAALACLQTTSTMHLHQAPLNIRAAHLLADAAAWAVSLVRPLSTFTEEVQDEAGEWTEATSRNVLVTASGLSPWRIDLWTDRDEETEGCLHLHAFGCHVEVFYRRTPLTAAA